MYTPMSDTELSISSFLLFEGIIAVELRATGRAFPLEVPEAPDMWQVAGGAGQKHDCLSGKLFEGLGEKVGSHLQEYAESDLLFDVSMSVWESPNTF